MSRRRISRLLASRVIGLTLVLFLGLLTLIGSGGGSGFDLPLAFDQSPAGIYFGFFTSTTAGPNQVLGIISEDFDAQFFSSQLHYAGNVAVDGDTLTGTLTDYRGSRNAFFGFGGVSSITLEGSVATAGGMFGEYTGTNDEGRFNLDYLDSYERASSLDLLAGVWTYSLASSGGGVYVVTFDIAADGIIFGSDTDGCVFNGELRVIDDRYNAYRAVMSISSCNDVVGDYSGLASFSDEPAGPDRLDLAINNARFAFRAPLSN